MEAEVGEGGACGWREARSSFVSHGGFALRSRQHGGRRGRCVCAGGALLGGEEKWTSTKVDVDESGADVRGQKARTLAAGQLLDDEVRTKSARAKHEHYTLSEGNRLFSVMLDRF